MSGEEDIRTKAERLLREHEPREDAPSWYSNVANVIEELQIHQIELELQNEELRNTQVELQAAQKKYLNLYNYAPVGYVTFDPDGLVLEMNITASRYFDVPRKQLVGRTITPYLTQASIMPFYQHCHTTLGRADTSQPQTCELTMTVPTDRPRIIALESVPVFNEEGAPVQIRSAIIDVTRQKLAENRLRVSEANWAALVNNTADLIWAVDRKQTIIRANDALRAIVKSNMGYRLESGSDLFRIFPPEMDGLWRSLLGQAFSGKNLVVEMEMWNEVFEVSINPFLAGEATATGVVVYAHNISERKALEKTLRDRNRQLDSFAHKIAHGLNSPLSMLTGYADYITRHANEVDVEELKRLGGKIDDAARQASKIMDELLFLADSSREKFVPTPLNLPQIFDRVIERLDNAPSETRAEITLPDSLPVALGYAPWVEKVCLNLVSIALEAAPSPQQITVGGEKPSTDGRVRCWIRTQEPASPPANADFGVELAVMEQVMQRMDGEIGLNRLPEGVLELYFTLPAAQSSALTSP
ncbi:MAG: hypothetical protein Kow0031_08490 [Anaerolineae bacterium]